jgi:mannosyltransferase OCH1-like enzyme
LGSKEIPKYFRPCIESWERYHPGWKLELWRDETLPPLSCQTEFERATSFKVRYDIVRYELLRQLGGVIVDMDMEAIRPIDPLLEGVVAFGIRGKRIPTSVLGAVPHHPFFEQVVERLRETVDNRSPSSDQAGPALLERVADEYDGGDLTFFPSRAFFSPFTIEPPIRPDAFPEIYAVHHHFESWRGTDARFPNLQKRLRITERALLRERRRNQKLVEKLSRLKQRGDRKQAA